MAKKYTFRNYVSYLKDNPKGYWFKRRLYGWGWAPATWQGWLIVLAFISVILLDGLWLVSNAPNGQEPSTMVSTIFMGIIAISIIALIVLCYIKGEKPGWSWGRN